MRPKNQSRQTQFGISNKRSQTRGENASIFISAILGYFCLLVCFFTFTQTNTETGYDFHCLYVLLQVMAKFTTRATGHIAMLIETGMHLIWYMHFWPYLW